MKKLTAVSRPREADGPTGAHSDFALALLDLYINLMSERKKGEEGET